MTSAKPVRKTVPEHAEILYNIKTNNTKICLPYMLKSLLFSCLIIFSLSGCEPEKERTSQAQQKPQIMPKQAVAPTQARSWTQIKKSGVLKALKLQWEEQSALPRGGSTSLFHIELLSEFAASNSLEIQWQKVDTLNQMFEQLDQFKADIIPRHLTITSDRSENMSFTLPLAQGAEVLVGKKGQSVPKSKSVITVSVPQHTAYITTLKKHFKNWKTVTLKDSLNADDIADSLAEGKIDYSVLDRQAVTQLSSYRDDITALMELPETTQLAWAVSKNNNSLLEKLNNFIAVHHIKQSSEKNRKLDLQQLKKKKLPLRVITRNSPETYFLWRGELAGFEYELMREFAKRHKVRLEMVVADSYEQMKQLLKEGKGDLIAAGLTRTQTRQEELKFSFRYNRVSEQLVAHTDSAPIAALSDLKGRTITIRQSSAFWATAQALAKEQGVKVIAADENMPTELLIKQVADKAIDLTIADSNLISIEQRFRDDIVIPLTLNEKVPYAYAVREYNPQLLNALNIFIKKEYRGTFYNVVKNRYFGNKKQQKKYHDNRIKSGSTLSPYDNLVKTVAGEHQFDWRLITAQMFQESRFNPKAKSSAGALGLMQVLPRTAGELGYSDLTNPKQSIKAGIHYLDWTRDRFPNELPVQQRLFFALAAYNAGFGHVKDAQRLAVKMKLNPNVWFNNVEKAMLLLQNPKYYKKTRYGYCRGSEPVNYVREIQQRYLGYLEIKTGPEIH
jgi:membrane-bound lytic murein transglycosylase F